MANGYGNGTMTRRGMLGTMAASAALAMGLSRSGAAATLDEIKKRGFISVATEDDYQPFEFTKDGKLTGYDIDLLQAMEKSLPFKVRQDVIPWTGILPGVSTGKYDAAITAVLVTQERMQSLDFCTPVAETVDYYVKRANDPRIKEIKDLNGLTLGVESGSAMMKLLPQLDDMLKATGGKLGKVTPYQGYPEAYQDLAAGRLDFVVNTYLSIKSVVEAKPAVFALGQAVSKPSFIAWAVQKGNKGVLDTLNENLLKARKDGSMYALQKKWFGTTFEDMPEVPTANS